MKRRDFLGTVPALITVPWMMPANPFNMADLVGSDTVRRSDLKITNIEVYTVNVTDHTSWILVRLRTNQGLEGFGEGSIGNQVQLPELLSFYKYIRGGSPLDIEKYRQEAWDRAVSGGLRMATAMSAIEQAMWDLVGKAQGVPVYELLGSKLRDELPLYANINRATDERTPEGFAANAAKAVSEGFKAVKAAPFDGFPKRFAPTEELAAATDLGIACVEAIREAVGPDVKIMIDCHSNFEVERAVAIAKRLEPQNLTWYEEPVAPLQIEDSRAIRSQISQRMAGGEHLLGVDGFTPLCKEDAFDVIMPDVKHCGGIMEGQRIAAMAEQYNVAVAPHNPSGPVSTAATAQWCVGMPNFEILEYQWGEADWRADLLNPPEHIQDGMLKISDAPGLGFEMNMNLLRSHLCSIC
jgi:galactonate dehydratase